MMQGKMMMAVVLLCCLACGSDASPSELHNRRDADFDPLDVAPGSDTIQIDERCRLGSAQSSATTTTLDIFGEITYFAQGADLEPGTYRVVYEDGCMKYGTGQDWTVHAYPEPNDDYAWFVGPLSGTKLVRAPGTHGYQGADGAFADFEACVAANLMLKPVAFRHQGGPLGMWVADTAYTDNMVGVNDRNPRWRLEHVDCDHNAK